jgi:hypothetical protein
MEREWSGNARRLSRADRAEIERRIWGGETFETAAAAVGCSTKSIQRFLALTGGLKRRLKVRSPLRLSLAEREELSRGLVAGDSLRAIAMRLRRAPRRSRARLRGADPAMAIAPGVPTARRSSGASDPSRRSLLSTRGCAVKWSGGCAPTGLRNRSPRG